MWTTVCWVAVLTFLLTFVSSHPAEYDRQDPGHYLNSFLVRVSSREIAEQVAKDHGFQLLEKLPGLDYYHLSHEEVVSRSKRSAEDYVNRLSDDERVSFVEQQITLKRVKRTHQVVHDKQVELPIRKIEDNSQYYRVKTQFDSRGSADIGFSDKYYGDQWYLHNEGQTGGKRNLDLDVKTCWKMGYTGRGVVVSILDDGIDHKHKDLKKNYDPKASADFNDENDKFNDPTPETSVPGNDHGTRCAGEIAAEANNGICGVGIAYEVKIGGIRLLDGKVTDRLEAKALLYEMQYIDLFSASWGPRDDGCTMEGLKQASTDAMKMGVEQGRNGKGIIYVWATGNGGNNCDHCGADGYVSSIYSLSIQSMSDYGELPYFGERCTSTMAAVPAGGEPTRQKELKGRTTIKVVTTDINDGCIENFEGTSSAAPLASGCLALLLQAAPDLTWRDVQHLVAMYSRIPGYDGSWVINGAGYHVNSKFGFGLMDCSAMIKGAQNWTNVPEQHVCSTQTMTVESDIPRSGCSKVTIEFDGCEDDEDSRITHLEHVEVTIELTAPRRGDVEIFLTSPSGTRSELLGRRCNDDSEDGIDFKFMTVHNWMENPSGPWTLEVCNNPGDVAYPDSRGHRSAGTFKKWSMITYGHYHDEENLMKKSFSPSSKYLEDLARDELRKSREIVLKRAKVNMESKKQYQGEQDETDYTLEEIQELLDSFGSLLGARSQEQGAVKKSNLEQLYDREKTQDVKENSYTDKEIEDTIDEILAEMNERDTGTIYLKEILKQKRDEIRRNRIQQKRSQLIEKLEQLLQDLQ